MIELMLIGLFLFFGYFALKEKDIALSISTLFIVMFGFAIGMAVYNDSLNFGADRVVLEQRIRSICESSSELEIKLLKEDIEDFNKFLSRHQKNSTNIWMGILISDSVNEIKPINYD